MSDFKIENGILKKYLGEDAHVVVPEGVIAIGNSVFSKNKNLVTIELPESIREIGSYAFFKCSQLAGVTIPRYVTCIGNSAFWYCTNLKSVTILAESLDIEEGAFWDCGKLERIHIPAGVKHIRIQAFCDCQQLKKVEIASIATSIEETSFPRECEIAVLDYSSLKGKKRIAPAYLARNISIPGTDEMRAYVLLYQKANAWQQWVSRTAENYAEILSVCADLIKQEEKIAADAVKRVVEYMRVHADKLPAEAIEGALALLEEKGGKPDRKPFGRILDATLAEDPYETFVAACLKDYVFEEEAVSVINSRTKIHGKGSDEFVPLEQVRYIVSEIVRLWNACKLMEDGEYKVDITKAATYRISNEIAQMLDRMNREDLDTYLRKLINSSRYRPYVLAYSALASDKEVSGILAEIARKLKGPSKDRRWAEQMESALYLRDDRETMLFFDKIGKLKTYAQLHYGMDEQELRDTHMMPQFDFDEDGIKRYNIGGNIIEESIAPDLSCQLYDTKAKKVIRSMPKKSDDPKKAAACAADYAEFKKSIKDFYRLRMSNLHMLHAEGTFVKGDLWKRVYMEHPVIKLAARLLVWQDEKGVAFIPVEDRIVDVNGEVYEPVGDIQLAHVVSLKPDELVSWQNYFVENHLAQPFMQVWESIVQWDRETIRERFRNRKITPESRNWLRKKLETQGVQMRSDVAVTGFDYNRKPIFSNEGKLCFGKFYSIDYSLLTDVLWLTNGKVEQRSEYTAQVSRGMNLVIPQMDFVIARDAIEEKTNLKLEELNLNELTAAQLSELIDVATESKNTVGMAYLLNLKNQRFPDCRAENHLVLDW